MCYLRAICVSFGCVLSPPYPLADSTRLSARCARPDGSQIASHYLRPPPASPRTAKKGVQLGPVVDSAFECEHGARNNAGFRWLEPPYTPREIVSS
jgi:hypothetical protein